MSCRNNIFNNRYRLLSNILWMLKRSDWFDLQSMLNSKSIYVISLATIIHVCKAECNANNSD